MHAGDSELTFVLATDYLRLEKLDAVLRALEEQP
jgi:hypothetical protein